MSILLTFCAIIGILLAFVMIFGVTYYDLLEIRKKHHFGLHPFAHQYRTRPLVSIIITTRTEDPESLRRCLESLSQVQYRKVEIIVVALQSSSKARRIVSSMVAAGFKRPIHVFQTKRSLREAMYTAYRRYGHGELMVVIDEYTRVKPATITTAVQEFTGRTRHVETISFTTQSITTYSTAGLVLKYTKLVEQLLLKAKSVLGLLYLSSHTNIICRAETLGRFMSTDYHRSYFAETILVEQSAPTSFIALIKKWFRPRLDQTHNSSSGAPAAPQAVMLLLRLFSVLTAAATLCLPIVLSYFFYLAFVLRQPTFLILSWLIVIAFAFYTVWNSNAMTLKDKLQNAIFIPAMYIVFYAFTFLHVILLIIDIVVGFKRLRLRYL